MIHPLRNISLWTAVTLLGLASAQAAPLVDPPVQIPYTGYLQLGSTPAGGTVRLDVALFDPLQTQPVWQDTYPSVPLSNGRFNIVLGNNPTHTNNPIAASLLNISNATGAGPLQLQVTVNGTVLSPRQTLFAAPYANSSGTANHSPSDFTIAGGLSFSNAVGNFISFIYPGDPVGNGIAYRPVGATDALTITGAGTSVGSRLIRLFDNIITNGTLTTGGDITTPGNINAHRMPPALDSGFFFMRSDPANLKLPATNSPVIGVAYTDTSTGNIVIKHGLGVVPSQMMLQSCGTTDGTNCDTPIALNGPTGYHDSGSYFNPNIIYADTDKVYLTRVWNWWSFGMRTTNGGGFTCNVNGANCDYARFRVLLWR